MDPQDLMELLKEKDKIIAAALNGDITDPKVKEMLRKLQEAGLTPEDLKNVSELDSTAMDDLVAKSNDIKKEKEEADAQSGKLTVKQMETKLEADRQKKESEMQLMNMLDDLEEAFHIDQILDSMSERDKNVFEALNKHSPKLVSKFLDLMVLRYNKIELGLIQYSRFKSRERVREEQK